MLCACPLAAVLTAVSISLQEEVFPADVHAVATTVTDSGTFTLRLACTPTSRISRRYALRVAVSVGFDDVELANHEIEPPTSKWRKGERVDLELPLALPFEQELSPGQLVALRIGFVPEGGGPVRPLGGEWVDMQDDDDLTDVVAVQVPIFAGPAGRARLEAAIGAAKAHLSSNDVVGAWARLDEALRGAADDSTKERIRDELARVGSTPPVPLTPLEEGIVANRIRAEQVRVFRIEGGRMLTRGELHGALRVLERVGGELAHAADDAVLGALADAQRTMERTGDIRERLLTEITDEDQATVEELVTEHGRTAKLLKAAEKLVKERRYPPALECCRQIRRVDGSELYDQARERLEELGEEYLAATPKDQAEKVAAVLAHPSWDRTTTSLGHCFIYIGPKKLVEGIPAQSRLRFDLAYVFVTDLFGRRPNPGGDRITVYFKELFDFGGGTGGGKTIDIGRADPFPKTPVRVDNGLLYHELTHCIEDTRPVHGGFHEGLANLGAAYAHEALDQEGDALHSFDANLSAFRKYFLERDLEYWRIQSYGPSAGLFLHFVDTYSAGRRGEHDWAPLRRFFREYREAYVRDGREPLVMRSVGHHLVRAFGPRAFDDLMEFGFPLQESDRRVLRRELDAFAGTADLELFKDRFADYPNSQLPRDALELELSRSSRREDLEDSEHLRAELGVVFDWKTIGPFFAKDADPGAHPFPPEYEVDFDSKPETWRASRADRMQRFWQDPLPDWQPSPSHRNVTLFPSGWLHFDYEPYGDDNSAIYAVTHVTVTEATDATAHLRADDDVALFVNDRRMGSYRGRGHNGSSQYEWRGPYGAQMADGMRFPVRFEAGRNKVLVKVRNRAGTAGVAVAFSRPDGSRLDFTGDAEQPDVPGPRAPVVEPTWKRLLTLDHRSLRSKTKTEVGAFRSKSKVFFGADTDGGVGWRLFTVRPGFPKDSPSNLAWLKSSITKDLEAVRLDVTLASAAPPKMLLTIQGEGEDDGLSGWNLILVPSGQRHVHARLERYDRLVYQTDPVELTDGEEDRVLSLRYWDGWCTVELDGRTLLDRVSIRPIEGRHRIGLATWGPEPKFRSLELSRGR